MRTASAISTVVCAASLLPSVFGQKAPPSVKPDKKSEAPKAPAARGTGAPGTEKADTPAASPGVIPVVHLTFATEGVVPGIQGTDAFTLPIVCSADGVPFVSFIDPGSFGAQKVSSLDMKGGHAFSVSSIPGLYDDNGFRSFFVTDSLVGFLTRATPDSTTSGKSISMGPNLPPRKVYPGKHYDYLVEFDRKGRFKASIQLPESSHFWRIMGLSDGTMVALGYDGLNAVAQLFILDSDGEIIRTLEAPEQMERDPVLMQGQSADPVKQVNAESSLNWWLFAPVRKGALLYKAHSKSPVLEIGPGGAYREVPIESPLGYVLDGVIPSSDTWVMRFRKEDISTSGSVDASPASKNYVLYEVDPADGHLRRQIDMASGPFYSIACERDGILTAFSITQDKINLLTADLGH